MGSSLSALPRNPLVDANLLLDYLAWRFSAQATRAFPEPNLQHLSTPNLKDAFSWYLEFAKPIRTSPHVIAEIHGLAKSRLGWYDARLESFWRFAQQELARLLLQEQLVRVVEMDTDDLPSFGPTDTSLLSMASGSDSLLLTDERELRGRRDRAQIRTWGIYEILAEWQRHVA